MATIKAMVVEKLRQDGLATDDDVRKAVRQYLNTVCFTLPGENDLARNPIGCDFAKVIFLADSEFNDAKNEIHGKDLHERGINLLVEKVMEERDDLMDYPYLRKKLVEEIVDNSER